jgi:hypothetical protein
MIHGMIHKAREKSSLLSFRISHPGILMGRPAPGRAPHFDFFSGTVLATVILGDSSWGLIAT